MSTDTEWEQLLPQIFDYDSHTGLFRWKVRPAPHIKIGDIAGARNSGFGYVQLKYKGATILAQRAAVFFKTGKLPQTVVDHKDNRKTNDNRWSNLRVANRVLNTANSRKRRNSTSPYKGVTPVTRSKRWQASITAYGKRHYLGVFDTSEEAHAAYVAAAARHFGEFARSE